MDVNLFKSTAKRLCDRLAAEGHSFTLFQVERALESWLKKASSCDALLQKAEFFIIESRFCEESFCPQNFPEFLEEYASDLIKSVPMENPSLEVVNRNIEQAMLAMRSMEIEQE